MPGTVSRTLRVVVGSVTSVLAHLPDICLCPDSGGIADIPQLPLGVNSVALFDRRIPVSFRRAPLATKVERRRNMPRSANSRHCSLHQLVRSDETGMWPAAGFCRRPAVVTWRQTSEF